MSDLNRALLITGALFWAVLIVTWIVAVAASVWLVLDARREQRSRRQQWRRHLKEMEVWRQEAETDRRLYPVPDLEVRAVRHEKKRSPLALVGGGEQNHESDGDHMDTTLHDRTPDGGRTDNPNRQAISELMRVAGFLSRRRYRRCRG